jgi:hypothetical protein
MSHPIHKRVHRQGGFPSIAYEVLCTSRKFIQSITVGHPGMRIDKHIVRTDNSVLELLYGNGWLNSKNWQCCGREGQSRTFRGVYLICDGGYHLTVQNNVPGSPNMRWSKNLESVRKNIKGVFGILKGGSSFSRILFLCRNNVTSMQLL